MDHTAEIRSFLISRRARLTPEKAGVVAHSGARRVSGLRREEVAHLAGVSTEYYARLERGQSSGVSAEVVDAVARALQLDDVEWEHLRDLIRSARPTRSRAPAPEARTRVSVDTQYALDAISVPAFVQNARLERLASNRIGRALYSLPEGGTEPFDHSLFLFLDPRAETFFGDVQRTRRNTVALLRAAAGHDPYDEGLIALVGRLSTCSEEFRQLWASHDVIRHRSGAKFFHHPVVGDLEFGYQAFLLATDPSLTMLIYTVEPGSQTEQSLALLASWTAPTMASPSQTSPPRRTSNESTEHAS